MEMTENKSNLGSRVSYWFKKGEFKDYVVMLFSLIMFLVTWWLLSIWLDTVYLPGPVQVAQAFIESFTTPDPATGFTMWRNIFASLTRFLEGFALAFIIALPIGLLMGYFRYADDIGRPIVEIFRPIPPIAWVPFFLIILGSLWGPIWIVFLGAFFPILSNIIFGVRSVDTTLLDAAKTLGSNRLTIFTKVVLPSTIPFIAAGTTIGLGIAWMCIAAAEMLGAEGGGVGSYIRVQSDLSNYDFMFAGIVVIAILGIITVGSARLLERQVSPWRGKK
jgi:NitT/TauT family transport system permease protein